MINLGPGEIVHGRHVPLPDAVRRASELNAEWDRYRRGLPLSAARRKYPVGSIGDGYERVIRLRQTERANKGLTWAREQHSRDDWPRAWKWIGPLFGDCDPKTVTPEMLVGDPTRKILGLSPLVAARVSDAEAHRTIKVWRALWKKMAVFGYCEADRDPSLAFANTEPQPRQELWKEGEAVRLIKRAWREGYHGLAILLAVAWDSQLSPVDARGLREQDMRSDTVGIWFDVARAKTGRGALATLSRRTQRLLEVYEENAGAKPLGRTPIFRNRSGGAYSKDTLGDDFRAVRTMVFGAGEKRQLADFRRSGSVEALAGDVPPEKLSSKMANSLSASNRLHKTYGPVMLASVRSVDAARTLGRARLREQEPDESVTAPVPKVSPAMKGPAKPLK